MRPSLVKPLSGWKRLNLYGLLKHYITIAFRGLRREKSYTAINFLSFSISTVVGILVWQYVINEQSVDNFHLNSSRKYRINHSYFQNGELVSKEALTTHAFGKEVDEKLESIEQMVRVSPTLLDEGSIISNMDGSKKFMAFGAVYVEKGFLRFFNFPLAKGDPSTALNSMNSIVLTKETAFKHFGTEDPMNKTLHASAGDLSGDFIVTGVLEEFPAETHLDFDYLLPMDFLLNKKSTYARSDGWQWKNFYTYIKLKDNTAATEITKYLDAIIYDNIGDELQDTEQKIHTSLQPISEIYLDPIIKGEITKKKGSFKNILIFSLAAILILFVAAINYINLATVRIFNKKEELHVRQALGARKRQLIAQFFIETLLLGIISFMTALIGVYLLIPSFNDMLGTSISITFPYSPGFWLVSCISLIAISSIVSIYPAVVSIRLYQAKPSRGYNIENKKSNFFRKSLLTLQIFATITIITITWLVFSQLTYVKSKNLGVNLEQIFVVEGPRAIFEEGQNIANLKHQRFTTALLEHSSISAVCASSNIPGRGQIWQGGVRKLGDPRSQEIEGNAVLVNEFFTNVYDFDYLAGEPFRPDTRAYEAVIINESALKGLGLNISEPEMALNHSLVIENLDTLRIQAVVADAHWGSLHQEIQPIVFVINQYPSFYSIKINGDVKAGVALVESTFEDLYPNDPYTSFFLDEDFNAQYQADQRFGLIFGIFSILAIIISSLGLIAMISFTISQKMKELGIRKVLGASQKQLFQLLSKEYLVFFLIALVLATPLIYLGADRWLSNFAYQIRISVQLFLYPAVCIFLLMLFIVSTKIVAAMKLNPVDQLRDE